MGLVCRIPLDLVRFGEHLRSRGKEFVGVHEVAEMLFTDAKSARAVLDKLSELGYVSKWGSKVYRVNSASRARVLAEFRRH